MTERVFQERNSTWKKSKSLKVKVEELESLLGPDDSDVVFRRISKEAMDKKVARYSRPSAQMVRVGG